MGQSFAFSTCFGGIHHSFRLKFLFQCDFDTSAASMASSSTQPSSTETPNAEPPSNSIEPVPLEEMLTRKRKFDCATTPEAMGLEEYKDWILDPFEGSQQLIPPDAYEPAEIEPAQPVEPESN